MNYKKIYKNLIDKARSEDRKKFKGKYYESHHIIPDFMFKNRKRKGPKGHLEGDPNHFNNKVLLTAREHIVAHILLYKIYKDTKYEYSCGSALNFFFKNYDKSSCLTHPRMVDMIGYDRKYEKVKELGSICVSEKNKGWINVKNAETGVYYGRMSVLDERYLSGKFVHHSKGRVISIEEKKNWKRSGAHNGNYKEMTEDRRERLFNLVSKSIVDEYFSPKLMENNMKEEFTEFKKISNVWLINNFESFEIFIKEYNSSRNENVLYDPLIKRKSTKEKIRLSQQDYVWCNNGRDNARFKKNDIPIDYVRGRINVKNKTN